MSRTRIRVSILACLCLAGLLGWLGWQSEEDVIEQAGYFKMVKDDVQYFAPEPDFPLATEEEALAELQR